LGLTSPHDNHTQDFVLGYDSAARWA